MRWTIVFCTTAVCAALLGVCLTTDIRAEACSNSEYQTASKYVAEESFDDAEEALIACGQDPTARYLLGMFPRFGDFPAGKTEAYRSVLSDAADAGQPEAAAIHGYWLFEEKHDRQKSAGLLASAYSAENEWAVWFSYSILGSQGYLLSKEDVARVHAMADGGFPLAYGILASAAMHQTADKGRSLATEEVVQELISARELAAQGAVRGDMFSVMVLRRINKEFKISDSGFEDMEHALQLQADDLEDPDPVRTQRAHEAWKLEIRFQPQGEPLRKLLAVSMQSCANESFRRIRKICEMRSLIDHYVCMQPFSTYVDPQQWAASSAYSRCRLLRLRNAPHRPYY